MRVLLTRGFVHAHMGRQKAAFAQGGERRATCSLAA